MRLQNPEVGVFRNGIAELPPVVNFASEDKTTVFFGAINREQDWLAYMPAINAAAAVLGSRLHFSVVHDQVFFDALETPHKTFTPTCDYPTYIGLLCQAEISFMPLRDTPFNRAKSDLKFIEAGAARVVALASPIVYEDSIEDGATGLLFRGESDLYEKLIRLVTTPSLGLELANAARRVVAETRMDAYGVADRIRWYRRPAGATRRADPCSHRARACARAPSGPIPRVRGFIPAEGKMDVPDVPIVQDLRLYPVKALRGYSQTTAAVAIWGLEGDRRWMVVRPDGSFITQRELPAMARITARTEADGLTLSTAGGSSCHVPLPSPGAKRRQVQVWRDQVPALDAGDEAAAWLSAALDVTCGLVFLDDTAARPVDPAYARAGDFAAFSDGFPVLLTNTASLDALNRELPSPIEMTRFRPNIVITGAAPWAEGPLAADPHRRRGVPRRQALRPLRRHHRRPDFRRAPQQIRAIADPGPDQTGAGRRHVRAESHSRRTWTYCRRRPGHNRGGGGGECPSPAARGSGITMMSDDQERPPAGPTSLSQEQVEMLYYGAARDGHEELLAEFLRQGADPNRPDGRGFPPLILASYNGHAGAVSMLIDAGAAVDARDAKGATALAGVAFKDEPEIARQLIAAGAAVDAVNDMGRTPLMFAVMFGRQAMVDLLLEAGADPARADADGKTAIDLATGQSDPAIYERLRRALLPKT